MVAVCKGVCHRFDKPTTGQRSIRYSDEVGRCKTCEVWIDIELDSYNNRCNCCHTLLRRHAKLTVKTISHKRY